MIIPLATSAATIFASFAIYIGNKHKLNEINNYYDRKGFAIDINITINQSYKTGDENEKDQNSTIETEEFSEVDLPIDWPIDLTKDSMIDQLEHVTNEEYLTQSILTKLNNIDKDINAIISEYNSFIPGSYSSSNQLSAWISHVVCYLLGLITTLLYHRIIFHIQKYYQSYKMNVINQYEKAAIDLLTNSHFDKASELLNNALCFISRYHGENHIEYGAFMHLLAKSEYNRGNISFAESLLRKTLKIYDFHCLQDSVTAHVLEDLSELIHSYSKKESFEDEYTLLQKALHYYESDIKNKLWSRYENALKKSKDSTDENLNIEFTLRECEKMYRDELEESANRKAQNAVRLKFGDTSKLSSKFASDYKKEAKLTSKKVTQNKSQIHQISYMTSLDVARVNTSLAKILLENNQFTDSLELFNLSYEIYDNLDLLNSDNAISLKETIILVEKLIDNKQNIICPEVTAKEELSYKMKPYSTSPRDIICMEYNFEKSTTPITGKYFQSPTLSPESPDTIIHSPL